VYGFSVGVESTAASGEIPMGTTARRDGLLCYGQIETYEITIPLTESLPRTSWFLQSPSIWWWWRWRRRPVPSWQFHFILSRIHHHDPRLHHLPPVQAARDARLHHLSRFHNYGLPRLLFQDSLDPQVLLQVADLILLLAHQLVELVGFGLRCLLCSLLEV
jgi:hypothetical protein